MFFDVTRVGAGRPLRVAVAAIAYLDTLANGCVLHLVGGQSLQLGESAAEVEQRALDARADERRVTAPDPTIDHALDVVAAEAHEAMGLVPPGTAMAIRLAQIPLMEPGTELRAVEPTVPSTAIEADMRQAGVDWIEVLASGLGGAAEPADVSLTAAVAPPAPEATPSPAPKKRRRRGQPS